jgi:hypothetical protein
VELAATIAYLKQNERMDNATATARSLALKPECKSYETSAARLLGQLSL